MCWHQLRIRSFRKIARLTRYQIFNILCRKVDHETGLVELRGEPGLRRQLEQPAGEDLPCDYPGIFKYVWTKRLEQQGLPADEVEKEVTRRWKEDPIGRMQVQYEEAEAKESGGGNRPG